jgi:hypothetical protein
MRIWEHWLLGAAIAWGLALPVLAVVLPAYRGESVEMSSDGTTVTTSTSATLAQVNGWQAVLVVSVPVAIAIGVALLLGFRDPGRGPGVPATVLVGVLTVGTVLAMLTIGIYVVPVTACLVAVWAIRLAAGAGPMPTAHPLR